MERVLWGRWKRVVYPNNTQYLRLCPRPLLERWFPTVLDTIQPTSIPLSSANAATSDTFWYMGRYEVPHRWGNWDSNKIGVPPALAGGYGVVELPCADHYAVEQWVCCLVLVGRGGVGCWTRGIGDEGW